MCVSWLFPFFSEVALDGCEQLLHLPFCDLGMVPFDVAVVYRPRAGERAVLFMVRACSREDLETLCPLGAEVDSAEGVARRPRPGAAEPPVEASG